jgi:hypothetical protein
MDRFSFQHVEDIFYPERKNGSPIFSTNQPFYILRAYSQFEPFTHGGLFSSLEVQNIMR